MVKFHACTPIRQVALVVGMISLGYHIGVGIEVLVFYLLAVAGVSSILPQFSLLSFVGLDFHMLYSGVQ